MVKMNKYLEEMGRLIGLAEKSFENNPERAKRYVYIARRIGMRTKTRFPQELRKKFCRTCGSFLKKGKNCKIEEENRFARITCLECKRAMRYPKDLK